MKYIYIVSINRTLGSRHWYLDRVYSKKQNALIRAKHIKKKFKGGGYNIERYRLYD